MERKKIIKNLVKNKSETDFHFFVRITRSGSEDEFFINDIQVSENEFESKLKDEKILKWIEHKHYEK